MNTISRRSFLKLTGATAVAMAGTAMLSGCSINTVTIVAIQNGKEVSREKVPMPDFMTVDWAIKLLKPVLLASLQMQHPELSAYTNQIEVAADPDYPNNGRQILDENGNRIMIVAIKTNYIMADVNVEGTNLEGRKQILFCYVPVLVGWTTPLDASVQKCVQAFGDKYYPTTLSVRPDNCQIVWDGTSKASVTIYVEDEKKPEV